MPQTMFFRGGPHGLAERIWLARQNQKVGRQVRKYGWAAVPVRLPHDKGDRFIYTVGFEETLSHPELIIFDTPYDVAVREFRTAFEGLRHGELRLEDGMVWAEDDQGRCVLRKVHPSQADRGWFGLAGERRRGLKGAREGLEGFQFVLADKSGHFPWEPGYDEAVRKFQPTLYEPQEPDA
jgi:hypothetical protein